MHQNAHRQKRTYEIRGLGSYLSLGGQALMWEYNLPYLCNLGLFKVIVDKSCGEMSLLEQDTIENVSEPIKNVSFFFFKKKQI